MSATFSGRDKFRYQGLQRFPLLFANSSFCHAPDDTPRHCRPSSCVSDSKDPTQNILWVTPEGGGGPNYPNM
nr:4Fe-4S dicluster domain-containing protein [Massilia sp. YIM B02787]